MHRFLLQVSGKPVYGENPVIVNPVSLLCFVVDTFAGIAIFVVLCTICIDCNVIYSFLTNYVRRDWLRINWELLFLVVCFPFCNHRIEPLLPFFLVCVVVTSYQVRATFIYYMICCSAYCLKGIFVFAHKLFLVGSKFLAGTSNTSGLWTIALLPYSLVPYLALGHVPYNVHIIFVLYSSRSLPRFCYVGPAVSAGSLGYHLFFGASAGLTSICPYSSQFMVT